MATGHLEERGPQGETEVPNIIIVSDAVGGTKVDPDGEGHGRKRMKDISQKEETTERSRLGGKERRREIEVCLVKGIGLVYREEVHEKIQRHV